MSGVQVPPPLPKSIEIIRRLWRRLVFVGQTHVHSLGTVLQRLQILSVLRSEPKVHNPCTAPTNAAWRGWGQKRENQPIYPLRISVQQYPFAQRYNDKGIDARNLPDAVTKSRNRASKPARWDEIKIFGMNFKRRSRFAAISAKTAGGSLHIARMSVQTGIPKHEQRSLPVSRLSLYLFAYPEVECRKNQNTGPIRFA